MRKHIIFAPHADDEIIGCHTLLAAQCVEIVVFPSGNLIAYKEAQYSAAKFGFKESIFQEDDLTALKIYVNQALDLEGFLLFPDPNYEYHPQHKLIGGMGMQLVREGFTNILFYSTNMNAPYIREVIQPIKKRDALNSSYPNKETLWKYDHKYFLFEGYVNYNPVDF